jgi:hypothetical protein
LAYLYITEHVDLAVDARGQVISLGEDTGLDQPRLAISGSSGQSLATRKATKFIRLHTDAICSVSFGSNPTATTSNRRMAANQTEFFAIKGGNKVAVISNS